MKFTFKEIKTIHEVATEQIKSYVRLEEEDSDFWNSASMTKEREVKELLISVIKKIEGETF